MTIIYNLMFLGFIKFEDIISKPFLPFPLSEVESEKGKCFNKTTYYVTKQGYKWIATARLVRNDQRPRTLDSTRVWLT